MFDSASSALQASFVGDEVNTIIKDSIDNVLTQVSYEHQKVCLPKSQDVVTCVIL